MNEEKGSPFAAMTYQEQQDRWREWRSRQLEYKEEQIEKPEAASDPEPQKESSLPPMPSSLPFTRGAAKTSHRELDQVLKRHEQALKRTGAFQSTSSSDE